MVVVDDDGALWKLLHLPRNRLHGGTVSIAGFLLNNWEPCSNGWLLLSMFTVQNEQCSVLRVAIEQDRRCSDGGVLDETLINRPIMSCMRRPRQGSRRPAGH